MTLCAPPQDSITAGSCCCPEVKGIGYSKALRKALLAKTAKLGFGDEHHPVYEFVMEVEPSALASYMNTQSPRNCCSVLICYCPIL